MNDNLNNAIAELATGLGTSASELWAYMRGQGLQDYAAATIGMKAATCVVCVVAVVALTVASVKCYRSKDGFDRDVKEFVVAFMVALGIFAAVVFAVTVTELAGWIASPQGMVLHMLMEKLG